MNCSITKHLALENIVCKTGLVNIVGNKPKPKMAPFTDLVRQKYKTEQHIAKKNNYEKEFE